MITTTMQHMHNLFLVRGRYHSSGGSLLDEREWREMPPEVPGAHALSIWP